MERILIIRPSAIGDIVMASPMLPVLRRAYPNAHIAWLVEPALAGLLENHPDLDEVIYWPKSRWKQLARKWKWLTLLHELNSLARQMRSRRFDLCLDVQGLLRSRFLAWLSGARQRVGFESKEPGRFFMTRIVDRGASTDQMSSEYRHLVTVLGMEPGNFAPRLHLGTSELVWVEEQLQKAAVSHGFAVIAPFTTRPQKHWFTERWATLAEQLKRQLNLDVVILGGPSDRESAKEIIHLAEGNIVDFVGRATLTQSAAIIQKCALLVGVDTGLTHMGVAFTRPTVALFGSTCPYMQTVSSKCRVLYQKLPCSPCRRNPICDGRFDCMAAITVDSVMETARELLLRDEFSR